MKTIGKQIGVFAVLVSLFLGPSMVSSAQASEYLCRITVLNHILEDFESWVDIYAEYGMQAIEDTVDEICGQDGAATKF